MVSCLRRSGHRNSRSPADPEVCMGRDTSTDQGTQMFAFTLHTADGLAPADLVTAAEGAA
jgi:hypothetical protein